MKLVIGFEEVKSLNGHDNKSQQQFVALGAAVCVPIISTTALIPESTEGKFFWANTNYTSRSYYPNRIVTVLDA